MWVHRCTNILYGVTKSDRVSGSVCGSDPSRCISLIEGGRNNLLCHSLRLQGWRNRSSVCYGEGGSHCPWPAAVMKRLKCRWGEPASVRQTRKIKKETMRTDMKTWLDVTHGAQRRRNNKTQDLKLIKENQKLNSRSKIIYLSHASLYEYNMGSVGCSAPEKDKWMDGFLNKSNTRSLVWLIDPPPINRKGSKQLRKKNVWTSWSFSRNFSFQAL